MGKIIIKMHHKNHNYLEYEKKKQYHKIILRPAHDCEKIDSMLDILVDLKKIDTKFVSQLLLVSVYFVFLFV